MHLFFFFSPFGCWQQAGFPLCLKLALLRAVKRTLVLNASSLSAVLVPLFITESSQEAFLNARPSRLVVSH